MVLDRDAQGRISGKNVCDGCRLILSAAVWGVKLWGLLWGIPPVFLRRVRKWFGVLKLRERRKTRVWKVLKPEELRTRVSEELFGVKDGRRVMLQGSMNLRSCQ